MESGREAAHGDVVSLLASKDAEIAALAARVTELEGLVAALHAQLGRVRVSRRVSSPVRPAPRCVWSMTPMT